MTQFDSVLLLSPRHAASLLTSWQMLVSWYLIRLLVIGYLRQDADQCRYRAMQFLKALVQCMASDNVDVEVGDVEAWALSYHWYP